MSPVIDTTEPPSELAALFSLLDWVTLSEQQRKIYVEVFCIGKDTGRREAFGGEGVAPLVAVEHEAIRHALKVAKGSVGLAAKLLGVGRATLYRRLTEAEGVDAGARAQGVTP